MWVTPGHQLAKFKYCYILRHFLWKTLNCHIFSTVRAADPFPKLRARTEYQLLYCTKYTSVTTSDLPRQYLYRNTTHSFLDNPSMPQSTAIKYKFMTWIWSLLWLQISYHMYTRLKYEQRCHRYTMYGIVNVSGSNLRSKKDCMDRNEGTWGECI